MKKIFYLKSYNIEGAANEEAAEMYVHRLNVKRKSTYTHVQTDSETVARRKRHSCLEFRDVSHPLCEVPTTRTKIVRSHSVDSSLSIKSIST